MLSPFNINAVIDRTRKNTYYLMAAVLATSSMVPVLFSGQASAATLTSRKVTLSTSQVGAAATHTFQFNVATTDDIGSIQFEYCTTPLGTCTVPSNMSAVAVTLGTNTIDATPAGFALGTAGNAPTANVVKIDRVAANANASDVVVITLSNITNPDTPNTTFYPRITTYSDNAYTTTVDEGTVAGSTASQLTVNGRVQERLEFCVAAIGDAAALPTDCLSAPSTTTIDIGVIDNSTIVKAPVETTTTNGSNDSYGMAQVNTNAASGVVVSYFPEEASSGTDDLRSFRVPGATCTGDPSVSLVDQCFVNANVAGEVFAAGTERFGLNVPCIANSTSGIGTTANVSNVPAAYSNEDNDTDDVANCQTVDTGVKFAWNNSATAATLASSPTVVDDEIIKISFGATANATTPTGSYTVATTYIATPTF